MRTKGNFVFNGKSRETNISLSNDHQLSRDAIILDARRRRETRERERRRYQAVLCIQRHARCWIAFPLLAARAADALRAAAAGPARGLVPLCWDFEFIRRVPRREPPEMRPFAEVLLRALICSVRSGTLREELSASTHARRLCVCLLLDAYAQAAHGSADVSAGNCVELGDGACAASPIVLLREVLAALSELTGRAVLLPPLLRFAISCDAAQRAPIVALVRDTLAIFTDADVAEFAASASGREALHDALLHTPHDEAFAMPTAEVVDVLIGAAPDNSRRRDTAPTAKRILLEAIMNVISAGVAVKSTRSAATADFLVAMGKLVRLMPAIMECMDLFREWLACVLQLTFYANKNNALMSTTVRDLCHPRIVETNGSSNDSLSSWGCGCYQHGSTYLFSAEYGLKLLAERAAASLKSGLGASYAELDLFCSVFVWPLYNFSIASVDQQIESNTIVSKLVHTHGLIRSLWSAYQVVHYGRNFGDLSENDRDNILHEAFAGEALHLSFHADALAESVDAMSSSSGAFSRSLFRDAYPAISTLFFTLMSYFVDATDFKEGLQQSVVMNENEVIFLVVSLKNIIHQAHFNGIDADSNSEAVAQTALTLLTKLHVINEAHQFIAQPSLWITTTNEHLFDSITPDMFVPFSTRHDAFRHAAEDEEEEGQDTKASGSNFVCEVGPSSAENEKCMVQGMIAYHPQWAGSSTWPLQERCVRYLQNAPFTIPFEVRAKVFTSFLLTQKRPGFFGYATAFYVKRDDVFSEAFDKFSMHPDTPDLFAVRFLDATNHVEEGYGEGVYREFLVSLCTQGFAAEHGLFSLTDDGFVYPNPLSLETTGDPMHLKKIYFLGAMVGRALRDGVLQDVPFALHFRNAILGRSNSINNLKSFDHQLYRHLMMLLSLSEEEIDALALNFMYARDVLGVAHEVELLRGGRDIHVTRRNCLNYIHLVADFKLNRESARQTKAFRSGLESIVDRSWLRLFDSREIKKLFGGDAESGINVEDWKSHTNYHSTTDKESTPVQVFWKVVESMSSEQQKKLLKFSTSMNRPPLLGFRFLNPPFKLHIMWDAPETRLPSSSTCLSTLIIPPYSEEANARSKIVAAIEETADFGLT